MGWGDEIMGSGMARGFAERGKLAAFGDRRRIMWSDRAHVIFRDNPNVAKPGTERDAELRKLLEWVPFYKGHRIYNRDGGTRWIWNPDFRPTPGEVFFSAAEIAYGDSFGRDFILMEPNVVQSKDCAPNKQWPVDRYGAVAAHFASKGHRIVQFATGHRLPGVEVIKTPTFRHALAVLRRARLYIGSEGGLHHGAAAVGIPAVVLFGGFIPPSLTGYDGHANIAGGMACGSFKRCQHCVDAMAAITTERVIEEAGRFL